MWPQSSSLMVIPLPIFLNLLQAGFFWQNLRLLQERKKRAKTAKSTPQKAPHRLMWSMRVVKLTRLLMIWGASCMLKAMASSLLLLKVVLETYSRMDSTCTRVWYSVLHLQKQSGRISSLMTWKLMVTRLYSPCTTKKLYSRQLLPLADGFSRLIDERSGWFSMKRKTRPQLARTAVLLASAQAAVALVAVLQKQSLSWTYSVISEEQRSPLAQRSSVGVLRMQQNCLVASLIQGMSWKLLATWLVLSQVTKSYWTQEPLSTPWVLTCLVRLRKKRSLKQSVWSLRPPVMQAQAKRGSRQRLVSIWVRQDWMLGGLVCTNCTKSQMMQVRKMAKNIAVPISDCFVDTESSFGTGINEKMSTFFNARTQKLEVYSQRMKESVADSDRRTDIWKYQQIGNTSTLKDLIKILPLSCHPHQSKATRFNWAMCNGHGNIQSTCMYLVE